MHSVHRRSCFPAIQPFPAGLTLPFHAGALQAICHGPPQPPEIPCPPSPGRTPLCRTHLFGSATSRVSNRVLAPLLLMFPRGSGRRQRRDNRPCHTAYIPRVEALLCQWCHWLPYSRDRDLLSPGCRYGTVRFPFFVP